MNWQMFCGALIAAGASLIACRALIAAGPVDKPDEARKQHRTPTPTSGGLAIAFGFAAGLIGMACCFDVMDDLSGAGAALLSLAALFAYGFLLLGFIDDARPLSAKLKFTIFALGAIGAAITVGVVGHFPIGAATVKIPYWFALIGTALWIFTLVNAVNFMDGANGLAMGSVAIGLGALAGIAYTQDAMSVVAIGLCGAGAILGFLFWNFPHGKLFAGDSGSLFAGAIAALASLIAIHRTGISPLIPAIIFFPMLADTLLTLAWRLIRRRSLLDGHSEHLYQIAIHGGMSHPEVALIYWAAAAACGGVAYLCVEDVRASAPFVAISSLAIASIVVSVIVRRFASRRGVEGV